MKLLLTATFAALFSIAFSQNNVGIFTNHADVGNPKTKGAATYDDASQTYALTGGGYNIWFNRDEFHYLYKKISGDFILTANFAFTGSDTGNGHKKFGWMIRPNLDEAAQEICATTHRDGLTVLQWRALRGAYMRDPEDEIPTQKKGFNIIQLERAGKTIIMRVAHAGEPMQVVGAHDMPDMPDTVLAGLFVCAHDSSALGEAKMWNVRIDKPVPNNYKEASGALGSRLEILNVFDGTRKIIHEAPGRFEAPNWMPDGKKLLFNEKGALYTIPVEGGATEKLNTGSANNCNNDHGISFDGKWLAISSGRPNLPGYGSTVYVLPLTGGEPRIITEETPSYWHGWSPDGKDVAYVAQRNGGTIFNLYKKNINGGNEIALTTNTTGHVDGPEYSPDGKYIYYNANPTGTMQIWRMKPDGSDKEQVTFDEYHNWFPHISPDGKWMVFISFPGDIDPNAHPSYKRVMLRLMPLTTGGAPKVIAYLYGGQGTLNAPSWSPDGKHIAFVSNSEKAQ